MEAFRAKIAKGEVPYRITAVFDGGLGMKDYGLRQACLDAMATGSLEALNQQLSLLTPARSSHWLAQLDSLRLFGDQMVVKKLLQIWPQAKYLGLIATSGDLLFRCLASPTASSHLARWLSSGSLEDRHLAIEAICKARCVTCSAKNPGRSMFCGECYSATSSSLKKGWFRYRDAAAVITGPGSLAFTKERLDAVFADYFPARIVFDRIDPAPMPLEGMELDTELGRILTLLDFGQDFGRLTEFFIPLLQGVKPAELSDEEMISWAVSTSGYRQRESILGKNKAEELCSNLGFRDNFDLLQVARISWPNSLKLITKIREFDVYWPSLTLATKSATKLLETWNSPDLFEFRRALNLNDLSLLQSSRVATAEFLDALATLGLTLAELKTHVKLYGPALFRILNLGRSLNPEQTLAWIAVSPHPTIKLRLLTTPPPEVIHAATSKESSRPTAPTKLKHDWLHYSDPLTRPPGPEVYVQRSWGKRFWS